LSALALRPSSLPQFAGSVLLVLLGGLAGCASVQNTPKQEYVWEMGRTCDARSNTWYLDKVQPDGTYTIRGATNSVGGPNLPYFECMNEQFRAHPYGDWLRARQNGAEQPAVAANAPDSVSLATTDPKYQDYFSQIRQQIMRKWTYPQDVSNKGIEGEVVVDFEIAKSGDLVDAKQRESSGEVALDDHAMQAIRLAAPFPPVPDAVSKGSLRIHAILRYRISGQRDLGK